MRSIRQMGEKALEEMLQLRAKVLIGGILPSEAPPGSALAEAIAAIEEEMEDEVPCVCFFCGRGSLLEPCARKMEAGVGHASSHFGQQAGRWRECPQKRVQGASKARGASGCDDLSGWHTRDALRNARCTASAVTSHTG